MVSWRKYTECICNVIWKLITLCESDWDPGTTHPRLCSASKLVNECSACHANTCFIHNIMLYYAIICKLFSSRLKIHIYLTAMLLTYSPQSCTPGNNFMNDINEYCLFISDWLPLSFPWARQLVSNCFTEVSSGEVVKHCSDHTTDRLSFISSALMVMLIWEFKLSHYDG